MMEVMTIIAVIFFGVLACISINKLADHEERLNRLERKTIWK